LNIGQSAPGLLGLLVCAQMAREKRPPVSRIQMMFLIICCVMIRRYLCQATARKVKRKRQQLAAIKTPGKAARSLVIDAAFLAWVRVVFAVLLRDDDFACVSLATQI
jgi:hypothetical protein